MSLRTRARTVSQLVIPLALLVFQTIAAAVPAVARPPEEPRRWNFMGEFDQGGRQLTEIEISDDIVVYFHQRMIGDARVERDFVVYQFDSRTGELIDAKEHWRNDLPTALPAKLVSTEVAERFGDGEIQSTQLYYIDPDSDIFRFDPPPTNPCWVVRSVDDEDRLRISVVDAVGGTYLGEGVPPPYTGFSLTGPWEWEPCAGGWLDWAENARYWFEQMGYSTEKIIWPTESDVQGHIQSTETAVFYELAHGNSGAFCSGCLAGKYEELTLANEIKTWISGYTKMPFAFIGSCYGVCDLGPGTFEYEFRKGSSEDAAIVGYCHMSDPECADCWLASLDWQTAFFGYTDAGYAVKEALERANADYPVCGVTQCMRFRGDPYLTLVPPIQRVGTARLVPDEYATIQDAVNASTRGDTVKVAGGTYPEEVALAPYTAILGGYDATFSVRDPETYRTVIDATSLSYGVFGSGDGHVLLDGLKILRGDVGLSLHDMSADIRNCIVDSCDEGILISGVWPHDGIMIDECIVRNGTGVGIDLSNPGVPFVTITGCAIYSNSGDGVVADDWREDRYTSIDGNTIASNGGMGIRCETNESQNSLCYIRNNIITGNSVGVHQVAGSDSLWISYCDVWSNTTEYDGCTPDTTCISADPMFCDSGGGDYTLHGSSPCLGAGEGGADMGAYPIGCPTGPENLAVAQVGASLELDWDPPAWRNEADYYVVYRRPVGGSFDTLAVVPPSETDYVDLSIDPCETYYYKVSCVDTSGTEGLQSNVESGELCFNPTTDLVVSFDPGGNSLVWTDAGGPVDYYTVRRGGAGSPIDSIGHASAPDTTYLDVTTVGCPRANYTYEITPVYDTGWKGVVSNQYTLDPVPSPPSGLSAEWSGSDAILSWSVPCEDDINSYGVYRDTLPLPKAVTPGYFIGFTGDTTYTDPGLNTSKKYFYRIVAEDDDTQQSESSDLVWLGVGQKRTVPAPYATIQAAINASSVLDTVLVAPGAYPEKLTLKEGVFVIGQEVKARPIVSSGTSPVVSATVLTDLARFRGFIVDGLGTADTGFDCNASDIRIEDCTFRNCTKGVNCRGGGAPTLTANTITSNQTGVMVAGDTHPFLSGNTLDANSFAGVYNTGDPGPEIGRTLDDANDFVNMGYCHVFSTSAAEIDAELNWWDSICPDPAWFIGTVDYTPWTDGTHTGGYSSCTGVPEQEHEIGRAFAAYNYPNPFNPRTTIAYTVPSPGGHVRITIYDLAGRKVRTLVDNAKADGEYTVTWRGLDDRGRELASGVYFYRVEIGEIYRADRKMILLR